MNFPLNRPRSLTALLFVATASLMAACTSLEGSSPAGTAPTPTTGWTHQFGTDDEDGASFVAVDTQGNVLVGGWTNGMLGETPNRGSYDGFVRKLRPDGLEAWTLQLGSEGEDAVEGVMAGSDGRVYVAGRVAGVLPGQMDAGEGDAFAMVLTGEGDAIWTRQFGTAKLDWGESVAIDSQGNVLVSGSTAGAFPGQTGASTADNYTRKFDSAGNVLWTDQIGSQEGNGATTVVVDDRDNVYLVGSTLGPLPGTTHTGSGDVFVRKYDSAGAVLWTHEYGTNDGDAAIGAVVDTAGNLLIVGATRGTWDGQARFGGFLDAFLLKVSPAGELLMTVQFGTTSSDMASGVAVDAAGNIYIAGRTDGRFEGSRNRGATDAFVAKFNTQGEPLWTTQFGSPAEDYAFGVAVDGSGTVYAVGMGHLGVSEASALPDAWVVQLKQ
ncbi:MAG: hypothetical protein FJ317_04700 [SAR202 cluster bacterium]|nr:hypothetical protein [SAR202 cluster bacterium]